jgi:hypothetical protein
VISTGEVAQKEETSMSSVSPSNALSPMVMLASAIYAQPGVYALLLGSGVSRSAEIPTGWEIVKDLVRQIAALEKANTEASRALAASDPDTWWQERYQGDLGYSQILKSLAPTSSAARQGYLENYFVASEDDLEAGRKRPTGAHLAIAKLVKAGWVRLILTTNFDRLIEQSLEAAGVQPQVIKRASDVRAMKPLTHAPATVIKLHGDWTDLESRNTIDELSKYPREWVSLLTRIFNEYGLLISGWSAEWDKKLASLLAATPRRYPLYWDSRSSRKPDARNLLELHAGHVIESASADELFKDLQASLAELQQLAEPPLTTAMAIARLKQVLPDPVRRIELDDLIRGRVEHVATSLGPILSTPLGGEVGEFVDSMFEATRPLLSLLVQGVRYDDGTHASLWMQALQSLIDARPQEANAILHYPALLALRVMSIEAVSSARHGLLVELLTRPRWRETPFRAKATSAAETLHMTQVLSDQIVNRHPVSRPNRWRYKASHLLRDALAQFFEENGIKDARYEMLCDDVEYLTGLVQHLLGHPRPNWGEFIDDNRWEYVANNWDDAAPSAEIRFRDDISRAGEDAWASLLSETSLDDALVSYRTILKDYSRSFN